MIFYRFGLKFNFINYFFGFCYALYGFDKYSSLFLSLNGILIWLNLLHINIILIKKTYFILLNNIEYLILLFTINFLY